MVDHLLHLAEFIKGVELSGGTTPHVSMTVAAMAGIDDPLEKLWFAGCYALTYNWPTAERIWLEWRPEDFNEIDFLLWCEEHWAGIYLRKERKAVFRRPFFAESAASYLAFSRRLLEQPWPAAYEDAFSEFTTGCRYMGRYIGIRWMEVMRRAFDTEWLMPDIHADGGQHPRKALALVYPADAEALLGGNSKRELQITDNVAARCLLDLELEFNLKPTYYDLTSLLCEFKQAWFSRRHFPGKSLDSELVYYKKVTDYWGSEGSAFYQLRADCFPSWSLGEESGWVGARPELGSLIRDHGLVWSDAIYDYSKTTDFAHPALRDPTRTSIL